MKSITFIIFLGLSLKAICQLTDTTCLNTRWISVTPSIRNEFLFPKDEVNNIFLKLIDLAVIEKIDFYWKESCETTSKVKFILPHITLQKDTVRGCKGCLFSEYWMEFKVDFDMLLNHLGEDSIIIDINGNQKLAFPSSLNWNFNMSSINCIKIKEEKVYIKEIDDEDFFVSEIGFEIQNHLGETQIFWIDMRELIFAMKTEPIFSWFIRLLKRDYTGFQYAQESCFQKNRK
jgi:hypothetical protein